MIGKDSNNPYATSQIMSKVFGETSGNGRVLHLFLFYVEEGRNEKNVDTLYTHLFLLFLISNRAKTDILVFDRSLSSTRKYAADLFRSLSFCIQTPTIWCSLYGARLSPTLRSANTLIIEEDGMEIIRLK